MFENEYSNNGYSTHIGVHTPIHAFVYWIENGERVAKTICYSQQDIEKAIRNRTNFNFDKKYEIYRVKI